MSSMRAERTSEEIWMEVDRLVRKAHVKIVVPLPVPIPDVPMDESAANWTMPTQGADQALLRAMEEVQGRWNLLDPRPAPKPTRSVVELHQMLVDRISKLPTYSARLPQLRVEDIALAHPYRHQRANWTVPRMTESRNARQDVVAVIWGVQRQFDLALG